MPSAPTFRPRIKPCVNESTAKLREIIKQKIRTDVAQLTSPTGQGPAPTGDYVVVFAFCRVKGKCFPADDRHFLVGPTGNANDLMNSLSPGMYTYWILHSDPNFDAIVAGLYTQWRSLVQ